MDFKLDASFILLIFAKDGGQERGFFNETEALYPVHNSGLATSYSGGE